MSNASTYGRRRRPAGEGVGRYYRSLDPCRCSHAGGSQFFLVPTMADRHKNRTLESEAARKRESRAAKGES